MELMWNKNGLFSGISGRGEWRRNGDKFIFEMEFEWNGMELEWNGMEWKWNQNGICKCYNNLRNIIHNSS